MPLLPVYIFGDEVPSPNVWTGPEFTRLYRYVVVPRERVPGT